jgi:hypothetical protein
MLYTNTISSPGLFVMLAACVLGIGFLVRFFIELVGETNLRADIRARVHYSASEPSRYFTGEVDPGPHVALGVFRITTALASHVGREETQSTENRTSPLAFAPVRKFDNTGMGAAAGQVYRSS